MRSRMSALVLSLILMAGLSACNKQQSQSTPPANDNSAAQTSQPATTGGQAQPAPAQQSQQMAPQQAAVKTPPPPPPPPPPLVVPAGTSLVVRMGNTIDTKTAHDGDSFTGTLSQPVSVNGVTAIPSGSEVAGTVVTSKSPGRFKGEGTLSVTLTAVNIRGVSTPIQSSTYTQTVKGKGKRTAVMAGGGTGAGALIGGLAGGGKGALIGGLVGAGAGTAGAAFTGNKDLQIAAESVVTFKLGEDITVKRPSKGASQE